MLRASTQATATELEPAQLNLAAIADTSLDPLVPSGAALIRFTDALVKQTSDLPAARKNLAIAVGVKATGRAALVCANFEMMNRILDATGVPVPKRYSDIASVLGVVAPSSSS